MYHISATISACEKGQLWQQALGLLAALQSVHVVPGVFTIGLTYSFVSSACADGSMHALSAGSLVTRDPSWTSLFKPLQKLMRTSCICSACEVNLENSPHRSCEWGITGCGGYPVWRACLWRAFLLSRVF